jgi:hypothetical protein
MFITLWGFTTFTTLENNDTFGFYYFIKNNVTLGFI